MKELILFALVFNLIVGCSSTNAKYEEPAPEDYVADNPFFCSSGDGCLAIVLLIYGAVASIKFFRNTNLSKLGPEKTESVPGNILLKCYIQNQSRDFVFPCGPYSVDAYEKTTAKSDFYNLTGEKNTIQVSQGPHKVSIRVQSCGLTQSADNVKSGDIIRLEFPPECKSSPY